MEERILVVEDDLGLRDVLARGLREEGFTVSTASDGASALHADLTGLGAIVLDIGLPDADGRDVCAALRARGSKVPVLFLTARDAVTDRVSGFAAGGDDYLAKPFHLAELTARLRVALRRRDVSSSRERIGRLALDPAAHAIQGRLGEVPLSPTEFRLLACLLRQEGVVVRRRQLLAAGWPLGAIVSENTLDQYVAKLRRKIAAAGSDATIRTVRGVGYRIG